MAYSSVSYSANSSANSGKDYTYSFPAVVHDTANILITVGGSVLATTRYTVASAGGTITLEAVPGAGTSPLDVALSASNTLKIYRFTNRTSAEVVFSSGAVIQDEDLNTATDQGRYLALEAVDRANESIAIDESDASRYNVQIDGVDKRIYGVATPTDDKDAATKAYSDTNVATAAGSATAAATSATAAASSATAAAADAVSTAADVVLTNADVVSAEADKVQTGLDRIAVAADLVATNQDTIDTAADVVLAEADKVQTGLDRVATAADKVATNADVVLTAADEVLTRADTVLTAADVVLTHADVVLTNADVVSSAASAANAATSYDSFDDRYLGTFTTAAEPTVDNDGNALVVGALYFNTTSGSMMVYSGAAWIAATSAGTTSMTVHKFTASGAETQVLTGSFSPALAYTVNNIIVFLNGVKLDATDYTADNVPLGSIESLAALAASDELVVVAFKSFSVSTVEGDNILSTGETGTSKFLRVDGDGTSSWAGIFPSGTKMLFHQTAAPTGWTKVTTTGTTPVSIDDVGLRIVAGTITDGIGGSAAFDTAFTTYAANSLITNVAKILDETMIPSHTHTLLSRWSGYASNTNPMSRTLGGGSNSSLGTPVSGGTGGGLGHTHDNTMLAIDLNVKYVDMIIASKD